ncbi:IS21 family transposase [Paenibacillus naphthalenovorans]|uniref:IS21 family transposase n=1 Tax=Paenibacillus naphthalenovorans TaxID=162209 RepID=UPI003D2AA5A7
MTKYREILRLNSMGLSQRSIASSLQCSRNTVSEVLRRANEKDVSWPLPDDVAEADLQYLLFPEKNQASSRKIPDCEYIHRELAKSGVTLSLLWTEYCESCRLSGEIPLMYTQYCNYYRKYAATTKATMHIQRKPGEQMEVDWAGQTASVVDRDTGEIMPVYIFVAVLPCSQYAYVEGFFTQNQESWIAAHVNAFAHFGGVPEILVPDNLKTGVEQSSWYSPVINKTYHEMAEHYGMAVIPARVRKPKDKPSVEGAVGSISTWILAALRKQTFFTLGELNQAIKEKLTAFNRKPFQKKPGSRLSAFLDEEKHTLQPLPAIAYECATWKVATVQFNYHIAVENMHYSVPYEYIKHKVDVRITKGVIEVFYNNHRICSHPRLYGRPGQYHTVSDHMPEKHKQFVEWNAERFISWAEQVGPFTSSAIRAILAGHRVEQQGYKACMGVLKLADKYSLTRLEAACARALSYTPSPSYRHISTILKSGQDTLEEAATVEEPNKQSTNSHGFIRGATYYGRNS